MDNNVRGTMKNLILKLLFLLVLSGSIQTEASTPANAIGQTEAGITHFDGTATFIGITDGANGTILQGTNTVPAFSTATYPSTTTANQLLYSSASNTVAGLSTADNGVLITSSSGVPSILANGTTGQVFTATTGSPPGWATPPSYLQTMNADSGSMNGSTMTISGGTTGLTTTASSSTMDVTGTLNAGHGGSGAATLTGLLTGNGTSAFTGTAITQYNVLTGGASNVPNSVTPSATSGIALISQGSSSQPVFGTVVVSGGGSGATSLTGVLTGNGTSAFTASAITQHDVLVGGASNAITSVAPSATSGVPFISQGSSSNPVFGTAVVAGGGTGLTSTTAYGVLCGGTTTTGNLQNAGAGTSGQLFKSNGASSLPTWVTFTINGDSSSITGSSLTFEGYNGGKAGATVQFVGSGSTMVLNMVDSNDNLMIGRVAGNTSESGANNVGLGTGAMQSLTSGSDNVGVGYLALDHLTSGSDNTAVGYGALQSVTTNSLNTGVGYDALAQCTGSNNAAFGATTLGDLTTGGYNTGCGEASLPDLTTGSYNICLGYSSGVSYSGSESSNICIGNNGTASESNVIRIGTQGSGSAQQDACYIAGIVGVTVSNQEFVTINSSTGQLGVTSGGGVSTIDGDSGSATGSTITFNGYGGGKAGSTIKFAASASTIDLNFVDGSDNLMMGRVAGNSSISGSWNMGIGSGALNALTSGNFNTCIGYVSGVLLQSGSANTALGYFSLDSLITGTGNTCIGYETGIGYTGSESNNILISNGGTAGDNNIIRIGTQGSGGEQQNQCFIAGITGATVTGTAVLCSAAGQLGTISSSRRYKENIVDMPEDVSIMHLRPVKFNYKTDVKKEMHYGLIAEEVQEDFEYLCFYNQEGEPESVKYHEMAVLLLKEVQRLNKRIEQLEEACGF
jgi:hypothetical protein